MNLGDRVVIKADSYPGQQKYVGTTGSIVTEDLTETTYPQCRHRRWCVWMDSDLSLQTFVDCHLEKVE